MAGLKVHTAQTDYVNSLAEIKTHLKIDGSDDDTALGYIRIAVYDLDQKLIEGYYTGYDANFPRKSIILPKSPVSSISHVKYYADDDTATTWATSNYFLDTASMPSMFTLRKGKTYPTGLRLTNGLEIKYVAGYGASADVPQQIKQGCLAYASYLNEHRGDILDGKNLTPPKVATQLLSPFVIKNLSSNPYRGTSKYGGY